MKLLPIPIARFDDIHHSFHNSLLNFPNNYSLLTGEARPPSDDQPHSSDQELHSALAAHHAADRLSCTNLTS